MNNYEKRFRRLKFVYLDEVDSTNRWLLEHGEDDMVVSAEYQTAGKGQGNHTWESEKGANLLFSILIRPDGIKPNCQFLLSEVWALSLRDALGEYVDGIEIKWPNDIYWLDKKISGTLIETHLLGGMVREVVIGTGVNVNQTVFLGDAPNPVSLRQACGMKGKLDRYDLLNKIISHFVDNYQQLLSGDVGAIQQRYRQSLYRRDGFYWYEDVKGTFEAELLDVAPSGILTLRDTHGVLRYYEQREVRFVL